MKWAYFDKDRQLVYLEVETKVELFVPAKPDRVLMLFKNNTFGDFVVADYLTGVKLTSCKKRKDAKEFLTLEMSRQAQHGLNINAKRGFDIPEVNKIGGPK